MVQTALGAPLVVVRLGGSRYALPMASVAEVGRVPGITRIPGLPAWVAGVANWRGRVVAVLDLRPLLTAPADDVNRRSRLVVLSHETHRIGLLVDAVLGSTDGDGEATTTLSHLPQSAAALLAGQLTYSEGPCGLLDVAAVLALSDRLPRTRRLAG